MSIVGILMATFDGEKYIKEQLESILSQTYQNWVLTIHDDNSKDDTVKIIKEYKTKYPDKIIFLDDNLSTGGAKENFSFLLDNIDSNYDYVMFCDQDDFWLDNKIELTLSTMLESEKINPNLPLLVHTDLTVVDKNLEVISSSMFKYQQLKYKNGNDINKLALENVVTGCTMMINNSLIKLVQNIPLEAVMHDWWISIICLTNKGKIVFINKPTILYRQHDNNTIGAQKIEYIDYLRKLKDFREVLKQGNLIYTQLKTAGVKMTKGRFVINKIIMRLKRF